MQKAKRSNKLIAFLLVLLLSCAAVGCAGVSTVERKIPAGYLQKEEHFDPDGFQDYTDYCKYWYPDAGAFEKDGRWHAVSEEEIEEIRGYFENFRGWMEVEKRLDEYDFDPDCIGAGDYVRIEIGSTHWSPYDDYTLYFFDAESDILYYIHSNI